MPHENFVSLQLPWFSSSIVSNDLWRFRNILFTNHRRFRNSLRALFEKKPVQTLSNRPLIGCVPNEKTFSMAKIGQKLKEIMNFVMEMVFSTGTYPDSLAILSTRGHRVQCYWSLYIGKCATAAWGAGDVGHLPPFANTNTDNKHLPRTIVGITLPLPQAIGS